MISLILGIITIGLVIFHCVLHYDRRGRLVNKFRGPTVVPLLGNAQEFFGPLGKTQNFSIIIKNNFSIC